MRLTVSIRNEILDTLINRKFKELFQALDNDEKSFAYEIYDSYFTKEGLELLNTIPRYWFRFQTHVYFIHLGRSDNSKLTNPRPDIRMVDGSRILSKEQSAAYSKLKSRRQELESKRGIAIQQARAVICSVSTSKALIAAWPEIAEFVPKDSDPPHITTALAIPMAQLNEALGLL